MKDFVISVNKLTDEILMRQACEATFIGNSNQKLLNIYKSEHSPARTQLFWISLEKIPLFVSTHLLRHHVGLIPYQLTCRDDRNGGNPGLIEKTNQIIEDIKEAMCLIESENPEEGLGMLDKCVADAEWLKENADRYTPVNLGLLVNAQSLIDMAKLRLCKQAHHETIEVFAAIKKTISKRDPDLANMMVRKCVYRGGICGEHRCCGFNNSIRFKEEMQSYIQHFSNIQSGAIIQNHSF